MCSIFGYIARGSSAPDLTTLGKIVRANIMRGPHSFGFSWIDGDAGWNGGRLHCFRQSGKLTDHMGTLSMVRGAKMLIGHLRYATHGEPDQNINNHPHSADGGWFVHNGVVANHRELARDNQLWPVSECDSEVLGLLIEQFEGPLSRRCVDAIDASTGSLAVMGLWTRPPTMIVARRGNPLHVSETPEGTYFASLPQGLPGKVFRIADDTLKSYTRRDKRTEVKTRKLDSDSEERGSVIAGEYRGG